MNPTACDHSAVEQSSWLVQARIVTTCRVSAASPVNVCCQAFGSVISNVMVLDGSDVGLYQYRTW